MDSVNYVGKLIEYARDKKSDIEFVDVGFVGPDHERTFTCRVLLKGVAYPDGVGRSKKEAKSNAARNALSCLEKQQDTTDSTDIDTEASMASGHQVRSSLNYISWLNAYGQMNGLTIKPVETIEPGPKNPISCCSFVVGDKEYPAVSAETRKEAKEKAAKLVYETICSRKTAEPANKTYNPAPAELHEEPDQSVSDISNRTRSLNVESQDSSSTVINYIGLINEYCNEKQMSYSFSEVENCGPPNNPQFYYKLLIGNKEYPVGEGKNKKEAKQRAAQLAWEALQGHSKDSMVSFSSTASENSTPTTSRFSSEFDSIELLGSGGFGCVYKVRKKWLDMHYAIKIVNYNEKALREVKALLQLNHPHIVRCYDCWIEDSEHIQEIIRSTSSSTSGSTSNWSSQTINDPSSQQLCIQMELCDTKALRDWINERNKMTEQGSKRREESLSIAQQIVLGVEYIHSNNLIHRDLKPNNIMFGSDGAVKIGDFGLVTQIQEDSQNPLQRTVDKGTPIYMAPEQKVDPKYDHKVDIFSLGLIYFELLYKLSTGHERVVILEKVRCQIFPKEFTNTFFAEEQIIKLMLCARPEDRPEASCLKIELEKLAQKQNMLLKNVTV